MLIPSDQRSLQNVVLYGPAVPLEKVLLAGISAAVWSVSLALLVSFAGCRVWFLVRKKGATGKRRDHNFAEKRV